jgi:hypothetical protein
MSLVSKIKILSYNIIKLFKYFQKLSIINPILITQTKYNYLKHIVSQRFLIYSTYQSLIHFCVK